MPMGASHWQMPEKDEYAVIGRGITKSFESLHVLKGMSVNIPRGVTYCLLGPNGSGKTTLMRMIMGLVKKDSGEIYVLDEPLDRISRVYSRLGYMPQQRPLYPDLTVEENLEFYAGLYGIRGHKMAEKIAEVLQVVDLSQTRDRITGMLSGGMYQRISLACTLINSPDLLLLDEPTVGIDPVTKQSFWGYFRNLAAEGKTVIITTHIMEEAERCDMVGFMRDGRMLAESSPDELKKFAGLKKQLKMKVEDPEQKMALLVKEGLEVRRDGDMLFVDIAEASRIREVLDRMKPTDFDVVEPTLENAFLKLSV
ncbi:MAG: putative ABC transporter ATP-binding protein [Methanosaeta sp. PtaU1.Bin060]|nr:MAG: putative ABC transporter ATP-binding protein [Methanosaeta sp. PtaU1.Bin060]